MRLLVPVGLLVAAVVALYVVLALQSRRSPELGLVDGSLRPCKRKSNCVVTEDRTRSSRPLVVDGDPERAWERLRAAVLDLPATRIEHEGPGYLHAVVASRFFGFRDDLEARLDRTTGEIHLRSASRVGRNDRGVNRRRVAALAAAYERQAAVRP